jgi:hypothetical protein
MRRFGRDVWTRLIVVEICCSRNFWAFFVNWGICGFFSIILRVLFAFYVFCIFYTFTAIKMTHNSFSPFNYAKASNLSNSRLFSPRLQILVKTLLPRKFTRKKRASGALPHSCRQMTALTMIDFQKDLPSAI